ncbi:MAG: hypothetical protein O7C63_05910 [Alphaproteobacteria bacterium]|nr:hypothetical protein [Alphaproteobacteria bacterium]
MSETLVMDDLVTGLCEKGSIGADDVLALRRSVWADGVVDMEEAEAVFRLDQACSDKDATWTDFYIETLTRFFVWQAEPRGFVSDELADTLIGQMAKDGRVDQWSELELLIHVIDRATSAPEKLVMYVLDAVRTSILSPQTAAYGSNRPPAMVTAADAAMIRRVIHAPGGAGSIAVTRLEAELMFNLNDALDAENTDPEWDDVFVKAITCHLMSPYHEPKEMTAEGEQRYQAWIKDMPEFKFGATYKGLAKAFAKPHKSFAEGWREIDPWGVERAREAKKAEEAMIRKAFETETIDSAEAQWLVDRIDADGILKPNEKALLKYIKENSPKIDPLLEPLFAKAGV